MIRRLIAACVDNPTSTIVVAGLVATIGVWALETVPVDAVPDLSDNQTIVFTEWPGHSPQDVENQVTYPLSAHLQGISGVREIRGLSGFGFSQVYVVFDDATDFWWARTRVSERLQSAPGMPEGVEPRLGPEATPLGQIFSYTVEGDAPIEELRSLQDYVVRYALQAVDGVAEVASVGGYVRQYQIDVDPLRLASYGLGIDDVSRAVRSANLDVGAKTLERGSMEFIVRGRGFVSGLPDVENIVVAAREGVPILVRHIADVHTGPDFRRGALADELGERVGGLVTMAYGENPREVIARVREALVTLRDGLPPGVRVVPFYDRTQLIDETMATLRTTLIEEIGITLLIVLLFLLHARTSLIVAVSLPLAVLVAFIGMRIGGLDANLMSLAGIAIAIGTVVDLAIVVSENIFRSLLERDPDVTTRRDAIVEAAAEVAPAVLAAVATTVLSFLPILMLDGRAGRMFGPLAWTKTFALIGAVIVALALVPAMARLWLRAGDPERLRKPGAWLALAAVTAAGFYIGTRLPALGVGVDVRPLWPGLGMALFLGAIGWRVLVEPMRALDTNPVAGGVDRLYTPTLRWILAHRTLFAWLPAAILLAGALVWHGGQALTAPFDAIAKATGGSLDRVEPFASVDRAIPPLGAAFMPPLDEGSLLYMPSLLHQASLSETLEVMVALNRQIASVPEVVKVMGKLGRAETALDPAPVGMLETIVILEPPERWREGLTRQALIAELRERTSMLGVSPSWLQPIETRIVMLQSGLRAPLALEIVGTPVGSEGAYADREAHEAIEKVALGLEGALRSVEGAVDVNALRLSGKPYLELTVDRERAARYGVSVQALLEVIEVGLGGRNLTLSLEGRERYPIRVQLARELRDDTEQLRRMLVPTPSGSPVPLGALVEFEEVVGPAAVRTRDGQLTGYVTFNTDQVDEATVMERVLSAAARWRERVQAETGTDPLPAGMRIEPAGSYREKLATDARLRVVVPMVIVAILVLLWLAFRDMSLAVIVLLAVPVTAAGGFIGIAVVSALSPEPIYLTTAVWVGFVALFGIAVDDGAVMATYLKQSFERARPTTLAEIREAVVTAGRRRIRPCLMTTFTTILALVPVLLSDGRGADLMRPLAIPLVGGMLAELVTLFIVPSLYAAVAERRLLTGPSSGRPTPVGSR